MSNPVDNASLYLDTQSLSGLRRSAQNNSPEALRAVAQQFEALFLQQLFKSVRESKLAEGIFDSDEGDYYQEMFDKQISLNLSKGQGLGLADLLVNSLGGQTASIGGQTASIGGQMESKGVQMESKGVQMESKGVQMDNNAKQRPMENDSYSLQSNVHPKPTLVAPINIQHVSATNNPSTSLPASSPTYLSREGQQTTKDSNSVSTNGNSQGEDRFTQAKEFVSHLWPLISKASAHIGADPKVVMAQAALETGWGKHISRHADGRSTYNLFNIKTGSNWQGQSISKNTLEHVDGIVQSQRAGFRSYASYEESIKDYVSLLENNPRYQNVVKHAADTEAFSKGLQKAGFATDPLYADKIMSVLNSSPMQDSLEGLKNLTRKTI